MENIYAEVGRKEAGNFKEVSNPEVLAMADKIRSSYTSPDPVAQAKNQQPKDFNPRNNLFFGAETGASKKPILETRNYNIDDAYATLRDGSNIRRYDSYQVGRDNAEFAAVTQSTTDKWMNGITKMVGQVSTGIVGGTIGTVYGVIEGIRQGSFRATYDNNFLNYLDDLNEKLDYKLPNYFSKEEREAGFFGSLGSANFWAKDVLGGAAFTVSAIGSEAIWAWATGGTSLATTALRTERRIAGLVGAEGRAARAAQKLTQINKAKDVVLQPIRSTFANVKIPTKYATLAGKAGELANSARFLYTSAGYEAGFEARSFIREREQEFQHSFFEKNGRKPDQKEMADFQKDLTNSANALYGFNIAIVGSSNFATMGKNIFGLNSPLKAPTKWTNSKLFGAGTKLVDGKVTALAPTKLQKIARVGWGLSESALIEGVWEEGMQSVGSNTAKNWLESTYDPKYLKGTMDLSEAFSQGLSDTYGTKEGMKEVGVGMLIGALMGLGTKAAKRQGITSEFRAIDEQSKGIEKFAETYNQKRIQEIFNYSGRVQASTEAQESAAKRGDFVGGEHARTSAILAQLTYAQNLDYLEQTKKDTEIAIRNIDNATLMKEYNINEDAAEKLKEDMITEFNQISDTHEKNTNFAEYALGNKLTKEEKEVLGDYNLKGIKEALAYELTMGERTHEFAQDLLHAMKDQIGQTFAAKEITDALTIEDILLKAGKDVKKEAVAKEKESKKLSAEKIALQKEYQKIEKTLNDTTDIEAKKVHLNKMDGIMNRISEIDAKKEELLKEYQIMLKTANLKNPFGKNVDELLIDSVVIQNRENNIQRIKELIAEHKNIDPHQAVKLEKLVSEYGKAIFSFKRYSDLARQLYDPKLGVRGKRNFITEFKRDKSNSEVTVEFLEGLKAGMQERAIDPLAEAIEATSQDVQAIIEEDKAEKEKRGEEGTEGAIIPRKTPEEIQKEKDAEIQAINDEYDAKINNLDNATSTTSGWSDISSIKAELNKLKTKEEKLQWLADNNYLEAFEHNGKTSNYLKTATSRVVVKIKIGNTIIPFYISTGSGLKTDVATDKWYVFFGQGQYGWFNKKSGKDINTQYGVKVFQDIAEVLNEVGSKKDEYPNHMDDKGFMTLSWTSSVEDQLKTVIDFITPVQPTVTTAGMKASKEDIAQLDKNIQEVKDRVAAELASPTQAAPDNKKQKAKLEKERAKKISEIEKKYGTEPEQQNAVKTHKSIKEYILDLIKNSPYLLEYYGPDSIPVRPSEQDFAEFQSLALRALADPKINNDTISFKSPYGVTDMPQLGKNLVSLSKAEVKRLQELNRILSNWQLLEAYGNTEGVSVAEMLLQDTLLSESANPQVGVSEITESEFGDLIEREPAITDEGKGLRNGEVLQIPISTYASSNKFGHKLHQFSLAGLLDRLDVASIRYEKIGGTTKNPIILEAKDNVSLFDLDKLAKKGAKFTVLMKDGTSANIKISGTKALVFESKAEFDAVLDKAGLETRSLRTAKTTGYLDVYDRATDSKLKSDYADSDTYSPRQLYNTKPGQSVFFRVSTTDEFNNDLILRYQDGNITLEDLISDLKIEITDESGNKVGVLKAGDNIATNAEEFLNIRKKAADTLLSAIEGVVGEYVDIPVSSQIKWVFLGSPNLKTENGSLKFFDIEPSRVVDYGYIENGKLRLNGGTTSRIRMDYVNKLLDKNNVPVMVVKQGEYLVALPVALRKGKVQLGQTFLDRVQSELESGTTTMAKVAIELNQLLLEKGLTPGIYNINFLNSDSQTLFDEDGNPTKDLTKAIEDLDKIPDVVDVRTWLDSNHSKQDLVNEALSAIDMTDEMLSSPKPIIDLSTAGVNFSAVDWFGNFQRTGDISEELATEVADRLLKGKSGFFRMEDIENHPKVLARLKRIAKISPELKSQVKDILDRLSCK